MSLFFFFNDTATTEIYTLSLHDALPIFRARPLLHLPGRKRWPAGTPRGVVRRPHDPQLRRRSQSLPRAQRSEEHTSELQSLAYLVCRLLLEKKKKHC